MVPMIGKETRKRAFAGAIAAAALLVAFFLIAGGLVVSKLIFDRSLGGSEGIDAAVMEQGGDSLYDPQRDGEVIRLHIVANSDSDEDQRVKLIVRNEVLALARLGDEILQLKNVEAAEKLLKNAAEPLLNTVRQVLKREGADYDAQLLLGDFDFPDREYDGKLYPAGSYRALRILLGDAGGRNWWCVLFPPLCIVKTDEQQYQNGQNSENYALNEGKVKFESLFVRLFNKIFYGE